MGKKKLGYILNGTADSIVHSQIATMMKAVTTTQILIQLTTHLDDQLASDPNSYPHSVSHEELKLLCQSPS